jgi:hypothetical protein
MTTEYDLRVYMAERRAEQAYLLSVWTLGTVFAFAAFGIGIVQKMFSLYLVGAGIIGVCIGYVVWHKSRGHDVGVTGRFVIVPQTFIPEIPDVPMPPEPPVMVEEDVVPKKKPLFRRTGRPKKQKLVVSEPVVAVLDDVKELARIDEELED